jgi:hypothetical protein
MRPVGRDLEIRALRCPGLILWITLILLDGPYWLLGPEEKQENKDVLEKTNNMHWLYYYFILRIGSYVFRQ